MKRTVKISKYPPKENVLQVDPPTLQDFKIEKEHLNETCIILVSTPYLECIS